MSQYCEALGSGIRRSVAVEGAPKSVGSTGSQMTNTRIRESGCWSSSFPNAEAVLKQLQAVVPAAWNDLAKGMINYRDLPGFPIRTQVTVGDDDIISTVVAVKTDALSDADFLPPKDFQEVKIPNVEMPGNKPVPAATAKP